MAKKTKTKKATKKATPKAKGKPKGGKAKAATQLQVSIAAKEHLAKKFPGTTRFMDEVDSTIPGYVSTQNLALDELVGNGGVPMARILEISGPEGIGKSTIADHLMAEVQARDGVAYLWDTESARDHRYVDQVGIIRKRALQVEADTMEGGLDIMLEALEWHVAHDPDRVGIFVWDTVAGVPTAAEFDPAKTNERFGPAKLLRERFRKLVQVLRKSKFILVAVNQEYTGQQGQHTVKRVYGGGGIPYFATIRLSCGYRSPQWVSEKADKAQGRPPVGQTIYVKTAKNKVWPPFRSHKVYILFGHGLDNAWTLFDTLKGAGLIKSAGGWFGLDPDAWPAEVAAACPKWQQSHFGLKAVIAAQPELWRVLIDRWKELQQQQQVATLQHNEAALVGAMAQAEALEEAVK